MMGENALRAYVTENGIEPLGRFYGCYRGYVEDNNDPEKLHRIRLRVPTIHGDDVPSTWAWPKGIPAGNGIGLVFLPNKGDLVWVSFEAGDPSYPIWEYGHFAKNELPDTEDYPSKATLQTTAGHRLEFNDAKGWLRLTLKGGKVIEIDGNNINLGTAGGSSEKAALGETLVSKLEECIDNINTLTVPTAFGPSGTPINAPAFTALKASLNAILSEVVKLD